MEKVVENWDQRKDVENDEKDYGMCDECCDVGRENIEIGSYFTRIRTGMYIITKFIESIY